MEAVAKLYRDVIDGKIAVAEGAQKLDQLYSLKKSNGFLFSKPGAAFITDGGDVRRIVPAA